MNDSILQCTNNSGMPRRHVSRTPAVAGNQLFHLPATEKRVEVIDRLQRLLTRLDAGKAWTVEVKEHKPTRSDSQNRYLWGVVYATILREGGESLGGWAAADLHEYFLGEHFGWEVMEGFGKKRMRPIRHSSRLNKQEFSDYLAFIQEKAANMGIVIPDAEP